MVESTERIDLELAGNGRCEDEAFASRPEVKGSRSLCRISRLMQRDTRFVRLCL